MATNSIPNSRLEAEATHAPRENPSQAIFVGVLSIVLLVVLAASALLGVFLALQG